MRGLYTEKVTSEKIPFGQLVSEILQHSGESFASGRIRETGPDGRDNLDYRVDPDSPDSPDKPGAGGADRVDRTDEMDVLAEQFCDNGEGEVNRYNVYKITAHGETYVLKKSDEAEIGVYERFLSGRGLPVPDYFGSARWGGKRWILLEYVEGPDLRDYTPDMEEACSESISRIANLNWQEDEAEFVQKRQDDRFERYWKRINRRAECLEEEPELRAAYDCFLRRQLTCPRTLSNGDFLQFNAILREGKVTLVDWAFGGIMPYSLDIARMIAHGTEDRRTFPFYMTEAHKGLFVRRTYELLERKPDYERYLADIRLAVLNEYIEFIESELLDKSQARDEVFDYYYSQALALAKSVNGMKIF